MRATWLAGILALISLFAALARGDDADLTPLLREKLLPLLALRVTEPCDGEVLAAFSSSGSLSTATVRTPDGESVRLRSLTRLGIGNGGTKAKTAQFSFTKAEFLAARQAALATPTTKLPDGDATALRAALRPTLIRQLAGMIEPPGDVELEFWLDDAARVSYAMIYKAGAPRGPTATTAADAQQAKKLIAQLGAETFQDRQAAQAALAILGRAALPALRETFQTTKDPEVKERVGQLLETVNDLSDLPRYFEMIYVLRTQSFTNTALAGKRYVVKVTRQELASGSPVNMPQEAVPFMLQ